MIKPCGHRILVRQEEYDEVDEVFKSAKRAGIEVVKSQEIRYQASVDKGQIVEIGSTAWKDFGSEPWAAVGDMVVFAKNAGKVVEDPENKDAHFVILNDEDIVAIIKG